MKRAIALIFVAVMILALGGCASEGQQLYEKYASIIDMLEAKDYQGVIREVTAMAIQEQQGDVEKVPVMQVLCDTWTTVYENAPEEMSFSEDGTCTIGGKSMTWLAQESDETTHLWVQIFEDGQIRYYLSINTSDGYAVPYVQLYHAEEHDGAIYSGDHIGNYYNHPMLPLLMTSWNAISEYERVIDNFSVNSSEVYINGENYDWTMAESDDQNALTIQVTGKNGVEGSYTMTMSMRDGYPVVQVTDDASSKTGLYYNYNYEFDRTWPEYVYAEATENLNEYLENGNFWCDISETSHYDSDDNAISYLYDQFVSLGDYADAAQIVENWDSVRFNRAMRLLNDYLNGYGFYVGETYYNPNRNALEYLYGQFAEISAYSETAAILDRFTIVEDVELWYDYTSVDHMGNENSSTKNVTYEYNELGQVIRFSNGTETSRIYGMSHNAYYTYDDAGKVIETKLGYTDDVYARITPTYDDNGNKISEHVVNNSGEYDIFYTYDDQNRLIEMRRPYNTSSDFETYYYYYTYSYDDAGNLAQKIYGCVYGGEMDFEYIYTYTYGDAGNLTREEETYNYYNWRGEVSQTYTHTAECVCDDQGRVIEKHWTYGNTVNSSGNESRPSNASSVYTYTYGNVYFFDSTGMEPAE